MTAFNGNYTGITIGDDMRDGFGTDLPIKCDGPDETDIEYIGSIPGILSPDPANHTVLNSLWSSTFPANQVIASFNDTIFYPGNPTNPTQPFIATPGDYVAQAFHYMSWEKTIYTVDVICNSFYKGALVFTYDPVRSSPHGIGTVVSIAPYVMSKTVLVSGPTTVTFEVPWSQRTDYIRTSSYPGVTMSGSVRASNGNVCVQVASPLMCSFAETCSCRLVFRKQYVGLKVMDYDPSLIQTWSTIPNYADLQSDTMTTVNFGERLTNIRQVLKTAAPCFLTPTVTAVGPTSNKAFYTFHVPVSPWNASQLAPPKVSAGNTPNSALYLTTHPLVYFSSMYLAKHGSIRSALTVPDGYTFAENGSTWISKKFPGLPAFTISPTPHTNDYRTMREALRSEDGMAVDVEFKPIANTFNCASYWPTFRATRETMCYKVTLAAPKSTFSRVPSVARVDYNAGESFTLKCFDCVPPLWRMTPANIPASTPYPTTLAIERDEDESVPVTLPEKTGFLPHEEVVNSDPCDGDHPALEEGTLSVARKD